MNRGLIAGIIALVLLLGGAGAYFLTQDDDPASPASEQNDESNDQMAGTFQPVATTGLDFVATFRTTVGDQTSEARVEYDSPNAWRYIGNQDGTEFEMIITTDGFFSMANGQWIKYPVSASTDNGFDTSLYEYDADELAALNAGATYAGTDSCPSGTCDVWEVESMDGSSVTIYIDAASRRISQVVSRSDTATTSISYEYIEVMVSPPEKYTELELPA
ncbi:MAG TPA: hypothetical protein VGA08_02025 [Candidatus Saccharimonadales bacterium]